MQLTTKSLLQETAGLLSMLKSNVVTPKGYVVGKVQDVRVDDKTFSFEGITIKPGGWKKSFYVSKDYVRSISADAIMLSEEPVFLLASRPVVSFEGEVIGVVKHIHQIENQNDYLYLVVRPKMLIGKSYKVKKSQIKSVGTTIILKNGAKLDNL